MVTKVDRLRIVSDELWASAHDSLRARQKSFGLKRALPRLEAALALSLEQLTYADTASAARRGALRTELERLDDELARYADAIGNAGPPDTILQAIKATRGPP